MISGYNVKLEIGGKTIIGRTQDDLQISARTKESITKDDAGVSNLVVTGHDVTFKVSALMSLDTATATTMNRDDVIELALKTGSSAVAAVKYTAGSGDKYGGNAVITSYSESSNADAEGDASISLELKVVGAFAQVQ